MTGVSELRTLASLWGPILLSAVVVLIGSTIVWMLLKYENAEWRPVPAPGEDQLRDAVRKLGLAPGQYIFPHLGGSASPAEVKKKFEEGPDGVLLLKKPGKFGMAKPLAQTFAYYLVVAIFAAYVASHALGVGAPYLRVFQIVGASAFMGFGLGVFPDAIWFGKSWRAAFKTALSALIYACLMAGTFGWLWPR